MTKNTNPISCISALDSQGEKRYSRIMSKLNLKSVIWNEGKHYVAQCLNVDVSSFGKSKREALANLNEAVSLYFEDEKLQNVAKVNRVEVVPFALRYA
ncbi:MAG: hypothetical protein AAB677_02315 [Patescibacteria group bacterium]